MTHQNKKLNKYNTDNFNNNSMHFKIDKKSMYEVAVISTVSSGKSTIINALLGCKLLPSMNSACTFRTVSIIDVDNSEKIIAHLIDNQGKEKTVSDCTPEELRPYLSDSDESISDIWIEHPIEGIRNVTKALMVTDTPGVNNSLDCMHESITMNYFRKMQQGTILMVLNATDLGTYDEKNLLKIILEVIKEKPDLNVIFALNKCDEFDLAVEPLPSLMNNCINYLDSCGFKQPTVYPISALAALLFKMVLTEQKLSRMEIIQFKSLYKTFRSKGNNLSSYTILNGTHNEKRISVGKSIYSIRKLKEAITNTGIFALEDALEEQMINSLDNTKVKIRRC